MSEEKKKTDQGNEENKENSLEQNFAEIEEIIKNLESDEMDLDTSFALYESGMKKLKLCNEAIDKVEKKMLLLDEEGEEHEF